MELALDRSNLASSPDLCPETTLGNVCNGAIKEKIGVKRKRAGALSATRSLGKILSDAAAEASGRPWSPSSAESSDLSPAARPCSREVEDDASPSLDGLGDGDGVVRGMESTLTHRERKSAALRESLAQLDSPSWNIQVSSINGGNCNDSNNNSSNHSGGGYHGSLSAPSLSRWTAAPRSASLNGEIRQPSVVSRSPNTQRPTPQTQPTVSTSGPPRHWSVFYPDGIDAQSPVLLHYLVLGGWRTVAGGWDYFSHRRLRKREVIGHTVRWLHGAKPRDRFVFIISPVECKEKEGSGGTWERMRNAIFGIPPAFALSKERVNKKSNSATSVGSLGYSDTLVQRIEEDDAASKLDTSQASLDTTTRSFASRRGQRDLVGVEVVEVRHEDITAMDYSPRLLTSRLAIEAKAVYAYYFPTVEDAYVYYDSHDDLRRVELEEERGIINTAMCPVSGNSTAGQSERGQSSTNPHDGSAMTDREAVRSGFCLEDTFDGRLRVVQPQAQIQRSLSSPNKPLVSSLSSDPFMVSNSPHCNTLCPITRSTSPLPYRPRVMQTPTSVYFDTIVSIYSEDPNFNAVLREVLMPEAGTHPYTASLLEQRRMLSMYETGMPAWTIFLASTGLPYRRVLRLTFVGLLNIWPVISLFVGLYDLYKHLPQMKAFLSSTLAPLLDWIEERVTLRVSMLVTYIISVGLSVAASLTSFFSQFFMLDILFTPLRLIAQLLKLPFSLLIETVWSLFSIGTSFISLVWITVKLVIAGPFVLVSQLGALEWSGQSATVLPTAMQGTSLTLKWWRAWQEFWVTVASPVKNLAKAWYDSVVHVAMKAAKHEASIRRWYIPKLIRFVDFCDSVREVCVLNVMMWWYMWYPGGGLLFLHSLLIVYCVWVLLPNAHERVPMDVVTSSNSMDKIMLEADALTGICTKRESMSDETGMDTNKLFALEMEGMHHGNVYDVFSFLWEVIMAIWVHFPW